MQHLRARLAANLQSVRPDDLQAQVAAFNEMLTYGVERFDDLDDEAKDFIDRNVSILSDAATDAIAALPDSPEKRQMMRKAKLARGEIVRQQANLDTLGTPRSRETPSLVAAEQFVVAALQSAANIIHDISDQRRNGVQDAALIATFTGAMDDLLAATHLLRHGYSNQASSLLRATHESIELAELFRIDESEAELWATGSAHERWKKQRPAAVRKKLRKDKFDPLYAILSESGTHSSFRGFQNRSGQTGDINAETPRIMIWIGGTKNLVVLHMTAFVLMYETFSLVLGMSKAFAPEIDNDEYSDNIDTLLADLRRIVTEHLLPSLTDAGLDTSGLSDLLASIDTPQEPDEGTGPDASA